MLHRVFDNLQWKVTIFDEGKYLVQAPTLAWQQSLTRSGILRLDGVKFPVVPWEPKFSEGKRLTSLWVKIHGYPHLLWQWHEVDRMLNPLGAVLLEMDPGAGQRCNWKFVRVRLGICERDLLPKKHWMMTRDPSGYVSCHDLFFEVESERSDTGKPNKGGVKIGGSGPVTGKGAKTKPPPPPADTDETMLGATEADEKGKKVASESGCHSDDLDFHTEDYSSDEGGGLLAHLNQYYGSNQNRTVEGPQSHTSALPPHAPTAPPQSTSRFTCGVQKPSPIPIGSPKTPGVKYKTTVSPPMAQRSKSVGASPPRGRSLFRQPGTGSTRKHFGPTGSRKGLRSTAPKWPTSSGPPSPTGASPDKPILITETDIIPTPSITQEHTSRPSFHLPRKSLRIQSQPGPTSVLTKAKKRAREKGDSSVTGAGIPLITNFPFNRLTTDQVVDLFRVYQIQLGHNSGDQILLINAIKHMDRSRFEILVKELIFRTKATSSDKFVVVDNVDIIGVVPSLVNS